MAIKSSVALAFSVIIAVNGVRRKEAVARSCGNNGPSSVSISIVNGEDAAECEFPWQVGLWRPNTIGTVVPGRPEYCSGVDGDMCTPAIPEASAKPFCGGTLIHPKWILTAAHCIDGRDLEIVAGDWNASDISTKQQKRQIERFYTHPDYNPYGGPPTHDYALVHVDKAFEINDCVALACLPDQDVADDSKCFASGWGTLQHAGSQPEILQKTQLQTISQKQCQDALSDQGANFDGTWLCAQGLRNGQPTDACNGDSGGPLVCRSGGAWTLAGVTSGYGCAADSPGVWAKVHAVVDWVDDTVDKGAPFKCDNDCELHHTLINDDICDCSGCEDEDRYTCDSCKMGCPTKCHEYTYCT